MSESTLVQSDIELTSARIMEIETKLLNNASKVHTSLDVQKVLTIDEARDLLIESFKESSGNYTAQKYFGCYLAGVLGLDIQAGPAVLVDLYTMLPEEERLKVFNYGQKHHPEATKDQIKRAVEEQRDTSPLAITEWQLEFLKDPKVPIIDRDDEGIEQGEIEDLVKYFVGKLKTGTPRKGEFRAVLYYRNVFQRNFWRKNLTPNQHQALWEKGKEVYQKMTTPF